MNVETVTSEEYGNSDKLESLATRSRIPRSRLQFYAEADPSLIETIHSGVLLVMSFWSGTSFSSFVYLTDVISRLDPLEKLQVVVVDADGAPAFYELSEFQGDLHGHGEVAWIKEGVIQCTSGRGYNPSCYELNTKALLAASATQ